MEEINLVEVFNMFLRKWWLIVTFMIVCGTATYMYTDVFVQETYETDGSFYINVETQQMQYDEAVTSGKLIANARFALSCSEILQSRTFLESVSAQLGALGETYNANRIKSMLDIEILNETEFIKLKVTGNNPDDVYDILNCIMEMAPQKITDTVKGGSASIVDIPYTPKNPVGPNKTKNTLIGMIVGLIISALMIFLMELFDTHIKTADEIKNKYKLPVLGEIPQLDGEK